MAIGGFVRAGRMGRTDERPGVAVCNEVLTGPGGVLEKLAKVTVDAMALGAAGNQQADDQLWKQLRALFESGLGGPTAPGLGGKPTPGFKAPEIERLT